MEGKIMSTDETYIAELERERDALRATLQEWRDYQTTPWPRCCPGQAVTDDKRGHCGICLYCRTDALLDAAEKAKWDKVVCGSGLVEAVCEHGVGHPVAESALALARSFGFKYSTWMTHGCDGCCGRPDFPRTVAELDATEGE